MRRLAGLLLMLGVLAPGAAEAWWNKAWSYRKQVTVDTTPSGINIAGPVGRVPVLVRLTSGNFSFKDAADNGADLRFVLADDKTPTAYHIETFDPLTGIATVWVDVPTVAGGTKMSLWMYYGNKSAPADVNSGGTYDADTTLVYHYAQPAGTPSQDSTANRNNAATAPSGVNDGSIIGRGARFLNGVPLNVPATGSLALPAGGGFTFSTWVKPAAPGASGVLYARREGAGSIVIGLTGGVPRVVTTGGTPVALQGPAALTPGQWSDVAVAADGKQIMLYVGGRAVAGAPGVLPALAGVATIGGDAGSGFPGDLDETRLARVARSANQLFVAAAAEGSDGKFVSFGKDEEQGGGGGEIGFVVRATPLLDWVVIALCLVMLAIALAVMAWKAGYIGKSDRANRVFERRYERMEGDLMPLEQQREPLGAGEIGALRASPLARLYEVGIRELETRRRLYGNRALSGESVAAIRAELDARMTLENQRLDKLMVLLTIAISGGPFIGLLGTVMGVMFTFAGVGLAGDVNVNAIAPGISAALLATVAGLAAAIPALFGYNYLNSQITTISDSMRVFVDRLVTRLAETAAHQAESPPPMRLAAE